MAKELPFFKFEPSEWMAGRIQRQPLDTQATFINLCCKYWHKLGELSYDDACLDFGQNHIDLLYEKRIIGTDSDYIFIKFLDAQLEECAKLSKQNSINGLKSALARAQRNSTTVKPSSTEAQRNSTEEKRRDKKRIDESKPHIIPFKENYFESDTKAFEEIRDNQKLIEETCIMILSNKGWKAATPIDVIGLLKNFMASKFDLNKPKSEAINHFKNWLSAASIDNLIKLSETFKKSLQ